MVTSSYYLQAQSNLWTITKESSIDKKGTRYIKPDQYQTFRLDVNQLKGILAKAPLTKTEAVKAAPCFIDIPWTDGSTKKFQIIESPIMEAGLQELYPEIRTYAGAEVGNGANYIRLDFTPQGFHGMILTADEGTVYIDPYTHGGGDIENYICYNRRDYNNHGKTAVCDVQGEPVSIDGFKPSSAARFGTCELRTYRLAVAATGEYTAFHGGTRALAQAAQVTTINRVNAVYIREMAIQLSIVANNNLIVYTNSATDPFTNGATSTMINENQTVCDNIIGTANYDIGHVFGTNSGGLAGLGVICTTSKARGVTGSAAPIGDPFDIDFVAHEVGHQFGARHTQNNPCNSTSVTSMEPGSGSTIMGYAGICAPNVQNNSDDYFHGVSLQEIEARILATSCPTRTALSNNTPTISSVNGNGITIPANTPFSLTAVASDPDPNNVLTYCWEQMDATAATMPPVASSTAGPAFRSFSPSTSPTRYFPNLPAIIAGTTPTWEVLPGVTRSMRFRVTVRDNATGGGCSASSDITMNVDGGSGPFIVNNPSNAGIIWNGNTTQTVTWSVAGTNVAPVACANVNILLSTDGGQTYPTTLATNVANNGSFAVTVPNINTTTARVMVVCSNGTFFDISNNNFTIRQGTVPTPGCTIYNSTNIPVTISATGTPTVTSTVNVPLTGSITDINVVNLTGTHSYVSDLTISLTSPTGTTVQLFSAICGNNQNFDLAFDDNGITTIACPPTTGLSYAPNNPLSAFNGQSPTGNWTLTVVDGANQDGGSLNSWGVEVCVSNGGGGTTVDAGISEVVVPEDGFATCDNPITPIVKLQNFGNVALTSTTINYDINGGTNNTFNWTGNLAPGDSINVTLGPITAPTPNTFTFNASTTNPNSTTDANATNDAASALSQIIVATATPYTEDFSGGAIPANMLIREQPTSGSQWAYNAVNGNGAAGTGSIFMDNYSTNNAGELDLVYLPWLDFSTQNGAQLTFDVAYARYGASNSDTLAVYASNDCGQTYSIVYRKGGTDLATVGTDQTAAFTPTATQWRNETVNLAAYDGSSHVRLIFINEGGYGNNVYLDNINIGSNVVPTGDAGISEVVVPEDGFATCDNPITPEVKLKNFGATALTNVTINYDINGGTNNTFNWTGNLAAGDSINVTLNPITAPTPNVFTFNAFTSNPNGAADINVVNDTASALSQIILATALPYTEDFSGGAVPANMLIREQPVSGNQWVYNAVNGNGAAGAGSISMDNYSINNAGELDLAYLPWLDFSNQTGVQLTFDVAYARYGASNSDTLAVYASNDCGQTYSIVYRKGGTDLATVGADQTAAFTPTATQWRNETVNLTAYNNSSHVRLIFINEGGYGNNVYLDNINIAAAVSCNLTTSITNLSDIDCKGNSTGTATLTAANGTAPYTYAIAGGVSNTNGVFSTLAAGSYTATVTDAAGCSATQIFTITEPATVLSATANATTAVSCNNGTDGAITATATGGTSSYTYNIGQGVQSSGIFNNLAAGNYTVTVTDGNGCTATTASTTLSNPPPVSVSATVNNNATCAGNNDGSATATATGGNPNGYTYTWSNNQTGATINNFGAGNYTVTATDINGCAATTSIVITSPTALTTGAFGTNLTCAGSNDGSATATPSGGDGTYTFNWSNTQNGITISNQSTGNYTVTVTDGNGCTATASVMVSAPTPVSLSTSVTNTSCNGGNNGSATATATGGNPGGYTYTWSNNQTGTTISNQSAGNYTVTVSDVNGCSASSAATIQQPTTLSATAVDNGNGSATATGTGGTPGYTYLWDATANNQSTPTAVGLTAGNYTVTVTDNNGCTTTTTVTINITGLGDIPNLTRFDIMPNPNSGDFQVQVIFDEVKAGELQVTNVLGQVLQTYTFDEKEVTVPINIKEQASGVYFVVLQTNNKTITKKVTVTK